MNHTLPRVPFYPGSYLGDSIIRGGNEDKLSIVSDALVIKNTAAINCLRQILS
jgi:hypothetical protein